MMHLKRVLPAFLLLFIFIPALAQSGSSIHLKIVNEQEKPFTNVTVELFNKKDSSLLKVQLTDSTGTANFKGLASGDYFLRASHTGYTAHSSSHFFIPQDFQLHLDKIALQPSAGTLNNVTISARKPFIEMKPGKTVVNVESSLTSIGSTAMEALEKMPGVTVDKDGNISLKGRSGVTVMIDGKQTYLDASQLSTLLNGMSASQISTVEVMDQPSSKYDAAGNAGIINIRLKKNNQKGFNGSLTAAFGQGVYPKNNDNLQLNYRSGKFNLFFNYSINLNRSFTDIYALRKYFANDGVSVISMLEQPSVFTGTGFAQNLRAGVDYAINQKTSAGVTVSGLYLKRKGATDNPASWLDANRHADSLIQTHSNSNTNWTNGGVNFNFRHSFTASREISFDVDHILYSISGDQFFENDGIFPTVYSEASRANLPSDIHITSAKADYSEQIKKWKLEAGAKTSHITTDNLADYEYLDAGIWKNDLGKSNHFLYTENIHALYANGEAKWIKWSFQGGLRYEMTSYDANQLGNAIVKDSSFSRSYNSLFPSGFLSYEMDSSNSFSLSAGRRIDRPAFQKLNPFVFIINKYTYQKGNPFFKPQYTWNIELSHSYKNMLMTSLSYSITNDYFSQIFPADSNGIIVYTEGNLKRLQNFAASVSLQLSPLKWWSLTSQLIMNRRKMEGFIEKEYNATFTQGNFNLNNQFRFKKGWTGEISGFYSSKARNDIQEVVDPAGQLSIGIGKSILKNKGTIRVAARDIFYTQWMKGNTEFHLANEYFKLTRDTRVVNISFNYRFGKAFKTTKRSTGSAKEEVDRVGNG